MDSKHLMSTYARKPVAFERGDGVWLYTGDGEDERYLDALSGLAVCGLGHAHPAVTAAIAEQSAKLMHTSNIYAIPLQEMLAARLCQVSGLDAAFFCNSGAEAIEAAIKLARLHAHADNPADARIIVTENSFHGRTLAALTATANPAFQSGFEPLVPGFVRVPFDDLDAVQAALEEYPVGSAVLVEPIQCEGGINIPAPGYLSGLRSLCDRHGALLILDEVQTGSARTGKWFCYQHEAVLPDIAVTAKGLANGVPIGVCLARRHVAELFSPGAHGSTFGGNPLACRASLATLDTIEDQDLCARAGELGNYLLGALRTRLSGCGLVREIRGKGLILGIELTQPCRELVDLCLEHKLLINVTVEHTIRLLPPLIMEQDQADQMVETLGGCIERFAESKTPGNGEPS